MAKDYRQSTIDAINAFHQKQVKKNRPKSSKQKGKPERDLTEIPCMAYMRSLGWTVEIYEAKSTYDPRRNIWRNQAMKAGTCDCMGTLPNGIAVAVEFKAPGRLSSFNSDKRYKQRQFIIDRINANTFACVVDSKEKLQHIYENWQKLRDNFDDLKPARDYLMDMLPVKKNKTGLDDEPLFPDE